MSRGAALRAYVAHARWLAAVAWKSAAGSVGRGRVLGRSSSGPTRLLLAVADHFEPDAGSAPADLARARVDHWVETYPKVLGRFRDADGRPPRHTFFDPVEVYDPTHLDALAGLCREGFGEVEVHLHHDGDTADSLRQTLTRAVARLAGRHGLLGRHRDTGAPGYVFVHGNWALNNARPDGRWCGVNDEVAVLRETGCYADFTFPSAPSPTQPPQINRILYVRGDPCRPRGHERGAVPAGSGRAAPEGSILMIPGPLALNWRDRKLGVVPRLENACVQASQPATARRLGLWLRAGVAVPSRPDWVFVKLHAHGAPERDRDALVGPAAAAFHGELARLAASDPGFSVHYVTAREMVNLARAAEAGYDGPVDGARDFEYVWGGGRPAPREPALSGERNS